MPPTPPKRNTVAIVVAIVVALAIVGTIAAFALTRGNDPVSPPPPTASETTWPTETAAHPTSFLTGMDSPFCVAYLSYSRTLKDWSDYQSAINDKDYVKADTYIVGFLAAARELQAGEVPDDAKEHLGIVISYFEKVHAALSKGGMEDVSEKETLDYSLANSRLTIAGVRACYGG